MDLFYCSQSGKALKVGDRVVTISEFRGLETGKHGHIVEFYHEQHLGVLQVDHDLNEWVADGDDLVLEIHYQEFVNDFDDTVDDDDDDDDDE